MKRFRMILLSLVLLIPISVKANENNLGQTVTAEATGNTNIKFSNGYYGYCIDDGLPGAYTNDVFETAKSNEALNNDTNEDISQKLKLVFTQCFEEIFIADGNGGYLIDPNIEDSILAKTIYHYSDGQYLSSAEKVLVNKIASYSGEEIPDAGYSITSSNGDIITFYFMVLKPQKARQQYFFAYKIEVNQSYDNTPDHEHEFGDWEANDEQHWKECECDEKSDLGNHNGGEATCISKKKCSVCEREYGTLDSTKHTGKTELRNAKAATTEEEGYTGDTHCKDCGALLVKGEVIAKLHKHEFGDWKIDEENHWKECECKEKDALNKHEGGEATCISKKKCTVCGQEYGELDSKNHKTEIEVRGYVAPTKDKEGYTGDTYCKDCDALIKKGTTLSKLGEAPNTGDNSNILLWILAMITSAICCLLFTIKKKNI